MGAVHLTTFSVASLVITLAGAGLVVWVLTRAGRHVAARYLRPGVLRSPALDDTQRGLRAIVRRAVWARRTGLLIGVAAWIGYAVFVGDRSTVLGPSLLAVGYVAGVLLGEGFMPGPAAGVVRSSGLRARRTSDYVNRTARWVLAIVVVGGTATAAAAGLTASNGRSRAFDCSAATADPDPGHLPAWIAQSWSGVGWLGARTGGRAHLVAGRWQLHQVADWPGAVVVLPLLAVWTIGLTLAWVAVRRVVGRARFAEQPTSVALDDRLRTESARRIVAACGALFMVPSGMVLRTMGDSLLHACNPTGASFPGRYLLDLANLLVVLALIAVLGYPTSARASRVPAAGAPTGTAVAS